MKYILAIFLTSSLAFGQTYFLIDRFVTADAAPLTSPHITEPGGQSITVTETDGTLAIASNALMVTAQATPVSGDLGLRFASTIPYYLGRPIFFNLKFSTLGTGPSHDNTSAVFGISSAANVTIANVMGVGSVGVSPTNFTANTTGNLSDDTFCRPLPMVPNTTDTFRVAIILGGSDGNDNGTKAWYNGQSAAAYDGGCFIFIKKGATGKWLLQGKTAAADPPTPTRHPALTNYNSEFALADWFIPNDSLRVPYLQPIHYVTGIGANGTQLFDITPEVGAAYDSVHGNWTINASNSILPGASADAERVTVVNVGKKDVFGELTMTYSTGENAGIVLRSNTNRSKHLLINCDSNQMRVYEYTGSYTNRAAVAINVQVTNAFGWYSAAVIDSTAYGWYDIAGTGVPSVSYTSALHTFYDSTFVKCGIRTGQINEPAFKYVRFYAAGTQNEYSGLNTYFATARGRIIQVRY